MILSLCFLERRLVYGFSKIAKLQSEFLVIDYELLLMVNLKTEVNGKKEYDDR
jgi:hypothetical protein